MRLLVSGAESVCRILNVIILLNTLHLRCQTLDRAAVGEGHTKIPLLLCEHPQKSGEHVSCCRCDYLHIDTLPTNRPLMQVPLSSALWLGFGSTVHSPEELCHFLKRKVNAEGSAIPTHGQYVILEQIVPSFEL
jgi:hypothetical protein